MSANLLFRRAAAAPASIRAFSTSSPRQLARVNIIGNLADAPELQSTSSGREIVRYVIVSNAGSREHRKASFFRVTSFSEGNSRDYLMNLAKGTKMYVEGDISLNSYTDSNGVQRSGVSIVQRSIEVLRRPWSGEQQSAETTETEQQ
ncbi:hypothetical protein B0T10DRAFT_488409 [Thelonectria olida]|uniref:Single-stranded DNA-binding protein n=1 Tax=Thelonectria olida TaxID=1576542 RepID=A0A9P8W3Z9_9HYPO|nr:hypothetical protein B0T10DRAFT_488409 [Thelonectria olida]